ncbi:SIR2 family NAD-dependent protein deacylase [Ghiorsea bivora]|uniref:SIR2 family NAD-dependent protein deacylase n=1 Tax=Ghiorsea bivora TaxID=1485545 RepID=UPI00057132E9|nr:Sir2 family NAD-dependent protein deacetylase [Ghiorsea bivora]
MKAIQDIVDDAEVVIITAGAGMGVDSGLPDFRGTHGLWKEYPELGRRDLEFEDMANPKWFRNDPKLAWAFYGHRFHKYISIQPHAGFGMLLELCEKKEDYFVITSNVDNQFQKAAFDLSKIYEIHGSLMHFQCIYGCKRNIWDADPASIQVDEERFEATLMPSCPHCGRIARPNVMMFDDYGWLCDRERRQRKRFESWKRKVWDRKKKVLIIEVGAGTTVASIRRISEQLYDKEFHYSKFIRINPRDIEVPVGANCIKLGGLEGIAQLLK